MPAEYPAELILAALCDILKYGNQKKHIDLLTIEVLPLIKDTDFEIAYEVYLKIRRSEKQPTIGITFERFVKFQIESYYTYTKIFILNLLGKQYLKLKNSTRIPSKHLTCLKATSKTYETDTKKVLRTTIKYIVNNNSDISNIKRFIEKNIEAITVTMKFKNNKRPAIETLENRFLKNNRKELIEFSKTFLNAAKLKVFKQKLSKSH